MLTKNNLTTDNGVNNDSIDANSNSYSEEELIMLASEGTTNKLGNRTVLSKNKDEGKNSKQL